jgi:hypothetical protein
MVQYTNKEIKNPFHSTTNVQTITDNTDVGSYMYINFVFIMNVSERGNVRTNQ